LKLHLKSNNPSFEALLTSNNAPGQSWNISLCPIQKPTQYHHINPACTQLGNYQNVQKLYTHYTCCSIPHASEETFINNSECLKLYSTADCIVNIKEFIVLNGCLKKLLSAAVDIWGFPSQQYEIRISLSSKDPEKFLIWRRLAPRKFLVLIPLS
jgi:hypothetical protein